MDRVKTSEDILSLTSLTSRSICYPGNVISLGTHFRVWEKKQSDILAKQFVFQLSAMASEVKRSNETLTALPGLRSPSL